MSNTPKVDPLDQYIKEKGVKAPDSIRKAFGEQPTSTLNPNAPEFVPKKTGSSKKGKGRKTSKKASRKARKTRRH